MVSCRLTVARTENLFYAFVVYATKLDCPYLVVVRFFFKKLEGLYSFVRCRPRYSSSAKSYSPTKPSCSTRNDETAEFRFISVSCGPFAVTYRETRLAVFFSAFSFYLLNSPRLDSHVRWVVLVHARGSPPGTSVPHGGGRGVSMGMRLR